MKTRRWQQIETVFHAALERRTGERAAFLDRACDGDLSLRHDVESLLAAFGNADGILDQMPAIGPDQVIGALREYADDTADLHLHRTTARVCLVCSALYDCAHDICCVDGASLVDDPMALAGTVLDGLYQIEKLLGQGGMGAVYLARHALLDDRVAIKVMPQSVRDDPEWLARFMREGRAARAIRHPNAVTVHELRTSKDGVVYMVLEYVEGHTLRAEMERRGRFAPADALEVLGAVAGALDVAHANGIVHRDLKPENVMLGTSGVKLLDLGIAKFQGVSDPAAEGAGPEDIASLTQPGQWMGTPRYMPPEQWGEPPSDGSVEIDGRADVYSLGVVAYELLAGCPPMTGGTLGELRRAHVSTVPRPVNEIVPNVPEAFGRAIARALSKDRADRPSSAGAFVAQLRAALEGGAAAPNNLPSSMTSFVGRERQIAEVREAVERGRLVTLAGPGGIGKTRLALEVARSAPDRFRDGVWLVELAGLNDGSLVPSTVAKVLDVREEAGRPLLDALTDALKSKELLLVLDNCEHLLDACAECVECLLHASGGLRVLATSREGLGVAGEAVWPVPPLAVPAGDSAEALEACEVVRLFVDRARLGKPDFALTQGNAGAVGELCRRLEGIPLAVELAAARVRVLPVERIVEKMEDRFQLLVGGGRTAAHRQRTLRAAIDWGYELLTGGEQVLFRCLSVFAGGWTLEAAEAVARGPAGAVDDVLDLLTHLVDKSLVTVDEVRGQARYRMLETIRQYAREKLAEAGEAEGVLRAHCDWCLGLAQKAGNELRGPDQREWAKVLDTEHDNLRAAIDWSLRVARDVEGSVRLAVALGYFWQLRGRSGEGRRTIEQALALGEATPATRADALFALAALADTSAEYERALVFAEECVALRRRLGDEVGIARASNFWGTYAWLTGKHELGCAILEENLLLCRKLGLTEIANRTVFYLGARALCVGELERAMAYFDEVLPAYQDAGNAWFVATILDNVGETARLQGDFDRALKALKEARAIGRELGATLTLADNGVSLIRILIDKREYESAVQVFEESVVLYRSLSHAEGLIDMVESAAFAAAGEDPARALRIAGAAANCRRVLQMPQQVVHEAELARRLDPVRATLTAEQIEHERARGQAMTLDEAVDYALETLVSLRAPRPRP